MGAIIKPVDYDSPRELSTLLEGLGLGMRKKYGQNFLVSSKARRRIIKLLNPKPGTRVWEIGPGAGAMTFEALCCGLTLSTFEIDQGFAAYMRASYGTIHGFELHEGDFVRTWPRALAASGAPTAIFGNLPYNAAGAIVAAIIEGGLRPERMVFTVQKEAAQRMAAVPSTKPYAAFSVLCQSAYQVSTAFDLSAGVFWPQPRVTSSVVLMNLRSDPLPLAGEKRFTSFVRVCFSSRRKTLRNNLKAAGFSEEQILEGCSRSAISADARAETLSPERFAMLHAAMSETRLLAD
jgi:16S rRNA (adenine1518-N6/adenine1519-N6)-dimethyltransferase